MEQILAKASSQAVTFAIRSGISLASGFAIKAVTKFLDKIPDHERKKILIKRGKIQTKISILSVTIELIKIAAARGNSSLEYTIDLINDLNNEFELFDETLDKITNDLSNANATESVKQVENYMDGLLSQINESIPILNLSLATCGINLNGSLSDSISPGRLLQASYSVNQSNDKFDLKKQVQIGKTFDMVFYTIFYNPSRLSYVGEKDNKEVVDELSTISWKEEFARCSVKVIREHEKSKSFSYTLNIVEDFNDGRYHEDEEKPQSRKIDIENIGRLFFSVSGKLLRLENRSSSVLVIKTINENGAESWIALGELRKGEFDDSDSEEDDDTEEFKDTMESPADQKESSLSLLEYIIRLTKVQQIEQKSILNISDEKLSLYLKDEKEQNNNSILPQTKREKERKQIDNQKVNDSLTLTSNMKRLKDLNLDK